jgi:hypothetical protein
MPMNSDPFFLSAVNPVATVDQRELEGTAIGLLARPEMQRARAIATVLWRNVMTYPAADQMDRFANAIDEYVFYYALRAANGDACYPKVLRIMAPQAHSFGRDVPGSRWGGDSPDFIYRVVPVEHGGRYEIHGRPGCAEVPSVTYSLGGNVAAPQTLAVLDSLDMNFGPDGSFTVTLDSEPAGGRSNHLQIKPGADHLLIRDALGDWLNQAPYFLRVQRLDAPTRAPLSEEALAQQAARSVMDAMYYTYYCTQSGNGQPPNALRVPVSSGAFGGMATQWGTKGNIVLEDDEAMVVVANAAGALFRNSMLCDQFSMSLNYWSRTGSLNMTQMAADDDGRFTYVIAHEDPGVHNWLDTGGLRRTIYGHRWQAFARSGPTETPTIAARVVKFKDLAAALPPGVRPIDAGGRREQIAARQAGFKRRFIES